MPSRPSRRRIEAQRSDHTAPSRQPEYSSRAGLTTSELFDLEFRRAMERVALWEYRADEFAGSDPYDLSGIRKSATARSYADAIREEWMV